MRPLSYFRKIEKNDCVEEKEDASPDLLRKIHKGAETTQFLEKDQILLLKSQGLIKGNKWM